MTARLSLGPFGFPRNGVWYDPDTGERLPEVTGSPEAYGVDALGRRAPGPWAADLEPVEAAAIIERGDLERPWIMDPLSGRILPASHPAVVSYAPLFARLPRWVPWAGAALLLLALTR
jgi:hypothetical protein